MSAASIAAIIICLYVITTICFLAAMKLVDLWDERKERREERRIRRQTRQLVRQAERTLQQ